MQAVFSQLIRIKRTIKLESFQSKTHWLGYRERIRFVFKNGCQERHSFVTWGYFETKSFSRWVINQYKDNGLFHRHWINLWVDSKHSIFSAKIKILRLLKSLTSIKIWYSGLPGSNRVIWTVLIGSYFPQILTNLWNKSLWKKSGA